MPEEVLTVREVAELLKTTPNTVQAWARSGKLPGFKIGQQWRIRRKDLDQLIEQRKVGRRRVDQA